MIVDSIGDTPGPTNAPNLRSTVGDASNPLASALGFWSPGDDGGGQFAWIDDDATDDGGTIIVPDSSASERATGPHWRRVFSGPIDVRWFGARGDGANNDRPAMQRAIDALSTNGGSIYVSPGVYAITDGTPLEIINDEDHNWRRCIRLFGPNAESRSYGAASILWSGDHSTVPVLRVDSMDCIVSHLLLQVANGTAEAPNRALCAIECDRPSGDVLVSNNLFEFVCVAANPSGYAFFADGALVNPSAGQNCEAIRFVSLSFSGITRAGIHVVGQANTKFLSVEDCAFGPSQYAVWAENASLIIDRCEFQSITETILRVGSAWDTVVIRDSNAENCARLLVTDGGSPNFPVPYRIDGGRYALGTNAETPYVDMTGGGPVTITGVQFSGAEAFVIKVASWGVGATLVATGCVFPNATPFAWGQGSVRRYCAGNRWQDATTNTMLPMADEWGVLNVGGDQTRALADLDNRAGTVAFTPDPIPPAGTDGFPHSSCFVPFAVHEPNAYYGVTLGIEVQYGAPAAGLFAYVDTDDKTPGGFVLRLNAAPIGRIVYVSWRVTSQAGYSTVESPA